MGVAGRLLWQRRRRRATPSLDVDPTPEGIVTCRSFYCHGGTLSGGQVPSPRWNPPDEAATRCDACHGSPPPAPHPPYTRCGVCHSPVVAADGTIADRQRHIDGHLDLAELSGCGGCHGTLENPAPPPDLSGDTTPDKPGVGAHQAHLTASQNLSSPVVCAACHHVPATVLAPGHLDDGVPGADGVTPGWNASSGRCSST